MGMGGLFPSCIKVVQVCRILRAQQNQFPAGVAQGLRRAREGGGYEKGESGKT